MRYGIKYISILMMLVFVLLSTLVACTSESDDVDRADISTSNNSQPDTKKDPSLESEPKADKFKGKYDHLGNSFSQAWNFYHENPKLYQEFGKENFLGIENETDYDHISMKVNVSNQDSEKIIAYTLESDNPGVGFYFITYPFLFFLDQDKEVPLEYKYDTGIQWALCAIENYEGCFSTAGKLTSKMFTEPLKPGKYKLVVYAGDKELVEYFDY